MDKRILKIYKTLQSHYGDLQWWPANNPYEVIVGAILTQNTAWENVEKAIDNFKGRLTPEFIETVDLDELKRIIYPAGFYNQKSIYLKEITRWFKQYDYNTSLVKLKPLEKLRKELLNVKGVGQETADSILLYAFELPSFVVDAYTVRFCERYPLPIQKGYGNVKQYFTTNLPKSVEVYNNYHALIVINGKNHCKKKPLCSGCPLEKDCEKANI